MNEFYQVIRMGVASHVREVSFFTRRGAPENGGGDQVFFLDQKGDHLYFLKMQNILLNISKHKGNSC